MNGSPPSSQGGLCPACRHVRSVHSAKGSSFLLCGAARADPRLSKYPPQPMVACFAFEPTPDPS